MKFIQSFLKRFTSYVGEYGKSNLPLLLLVVGCVFMFLPSMFPDFKVLYVLGVWIWPFCFLYYCRLSEHRFSQAILYIFLAVGLCVRFYGVLGVGLEKECLVFTALQACLFWVPFAWDVRYCVKEAPFVNTLVFPTVYGTLNLVFSACDLIPLNNLSYAQYDNRAIFQVLSVVGEFGLTFLITFVGSVAVYVIMHWNRDGAKRIGLGMLLALVAMHAWGIFQMAHDESSDTVRIAQAIGPKVDQHKDGSWETLSYERYLRSFNTLAESAYRERAQMLVFSEEAFTVADSSEGDFIANASEYARKFNMPILLSLGVYDTDNSREGLFQNKVVLINNQGKILYEYNKHKPVPLVESFNLDVGREKLPAVPLEIGGKAHIVSFAICYDGNFSDFLRPLDPKVQLLFIPSWAWDGINDFHYRSLAVRAVEHGVNLVVTSYDGVSLVSDEYGREVNRRLFKDVGYDRLFISDVPTSAHETVYAKNGGFLNYVYLILSLMFIGLGARRTKDGSIEEQAGA